MRSRRLRHSARASAGQRRVSCAERSASYALSRDGRGVARNAVYGVRDLFCGAAVSFAGGGAGRIAVGFLYLWQVDCTKR